MVTKPTAGHAATFATLAKSAKREPVSRAWLPPSIAGASALTSARTSAVGAATSSARAGRPASLRPPRSTTPASEVMTVSLRALCRTSLLSEAEVLTRGAYIGRELTANVALHARGSPHALTGLAVPPPARPLHVLNSNPNQCALIPSCANQRR